MAESSEPKRPFWGRKPISFCPVKPSHVEVGCSDPTSIYFSFQLLWRCSCNQACRVDAPIEDETCHTYWQLWNALRNMKLPTSYRKEVPLDFAEEKQTRKKASDRRLRILMSSIFGNCTILWIFVPSYTPSHDLNIPMHGLKKESAYQVQFTIASTQTLSPLSLRLSNPLNLTSHHSPPPPRARIHQHIAPSLQSHPF